MIISPSFLLKLLAVAIIIFILLALLNFDKIFKKYIVKEVKDNAKKEETVPEGVFTKNDIPEEKSTGNTVTIPINEVLNIKDETDKEDTKQDEIEILEYEEIIDIDSNNIVTQKKNTDKERETELLEQIINLLKIKNDTLTTTRINKKWLTKFQYVYKLINILLIGDTTELTDTIEHPPFKEIYDYDLDKAGLYENLRNKIYDMPIYVFLRILIFAILYNDDTFFDGVYKIMKYKVQVDKDGYFKEIAKNDTYARKQLKSLITFMQRITIKFDNKNVFQLERIEKYVKLKNYVNN
jgi:hypothetical protein